MSSFSVDRVASETLHKRPRLGFAGVGWIGRDRMKAVVDSAAATIGGVFDPNSETARLASEMAHDCEIVESFDALLAADLDGVLIATPTALHAEQTIAALERGISVFCQKPLGRNETETRRAIDAAQRADRLLKVDLSYRFMAGVQHIARLIRSGELGDIYSVELTFHNAYGPDKAWFYNPKLSGGGCLIDLGVHLVDLGLWMLGFPEVEKVSGRLFHKGLRFAGRAVEVEDFATAAIDLETGSRMNVVCSWNANAGRDAVIEASFYGTRGGAKVRNVNGSFYDFVAERFTGTRCELLSAPPDNWGGRATLDWLTQLATVGNPFDPEIARLGSVAAVLDQIYES